VPLRAPPAAAVRPRRQAAGTWPTLRCDPDSGDSHPVRRSTERRSVAFSSQRCFLSRRGCAGVPNPAPAPVSWGALALPSLAPAALPDLPATSAPEPPPARVNVTPVETIAPDPAPASINLILAETTAPAGVTPVIPTPRASSVLIPARTRGMTSGKKRSKSVCATSVRIRCKRRTDSLIPQNTRKGTLCPMKVFPPGLGLLRVAESKSSPSRGRTLTSPSSRLCRSHDSY
jgi:hypothetical protein